MNMATILAYTSPALGHLLPISALLSELASRGHTIHVRTISTGADVGRRLGFHTDAIDPRIEQIELDDWKGTNPLAALKLSVAAFARRAAHEVPDFADAVASVNPDALLVDVNSWGHCRRPTPVTSRGHVLRRTRHRFEHRGTTVRAWSQTIARSVGPGA
jgi:hypothetical protein